MGNKQMTETPRCPECGVKLDDSEIWEMSIDQEQMHYQCPFCREQLLIQVFIKMEFEVITEGELTGRK